MPAISTLVMVGAGLAGAALSASAKKKAAKKQAQAVATANQQNIAAHTMTPEEKAQYFATGIGKINQAYGTSQDMAARGLANRGIGGGTALSRPMAEIGRGRARSIGDLWGSLAQTAMNMKSSTPTIQTVPAAPSFAESFFGDVGPSIANIGAYGAGKKMEKYFTT